MDLFEIFERNLRGKDYIEARGLSPEVIRHYNHACAECQRNSMLPAVQRIVNGFKEGIMDEAI